MSFNKVNQTTGELTRIAGNGDVPIDSVPTQGSTNAVQSGGVYSSIQVTKEIIAPVENGTTASKAYSIGDNFIKGDTLYKAKIAIAQGDTLTLNTNYELENDIVTQISSLKQTLEQSISNKLGTSDIANNLTTTIAGKVLDATQGKALNDSISATNTAITNKHKVTRIWVNTSSWEQDTTSQSGTTLYKKSVALSNVYVASPSVDIANANNSVLPSAAQQTDYGLVEYVTVDDTVPCLYIYASDIPTTGFWINVEGVD